jgi:hypothetical protein
MFATSRRLTTATLLIFVITFLIVFWADIAHAQISPDQGKLIRTSFEELWREVLLGENGRLTIFTILSEALLGPTILFFAFRGALLIGSTQAMDNWRSMLSEGVKQLLPVFLVILLLKNGGYLAGNMLYSTKLIGFGVDNKAYRGMVFKAGTTSLTAGNKASKEFLEPVALAFDNCFDVPAKINGKANPAFTQCTQKITTTIDTALGSGKLDDVQNKKLINSRALIVRAANSTDPSESIVRAGTSLQNSVQQWGITEGFNLLLNGLLEAIGFVYATAVEMALLILAIASAVVLSLSLLNIEVVTKFLPQLLNVFIAKLSYTIAIGLTYVFQAKAGGEAGKWFGALMFGLGCPFISIFITLAMSGSMAAVFERSALGVVGGAARAAGKAGGAAIGGARSAAGFVGGLRGGSAPAVSTGGASAASKTITVASRRV